MLLEIIPFKNITCTHWKCTTKRFAGFVPVYTETWFLSKNSDLAAKVLFMTYAWLCAESERAATAFLL